MRILGREKIRDFFYQASARRGHINCLVTVPCLIGFFSSRARICQLLRSPGVHSKDIDSARQAGGIDYKGSLEVYKFGFRLFDLLPACDWNIITVRQLGLAVRSEWGSGVERKKELRGGFKVSEIFIQWKSVEWSAEPFEGMPIYLINRHIQENI